MRKVENSRDTKVLDVMDPENTGRILPCCEHPYLGMDEDVTEGVNAFINKRKAVWKS